MQLFMNAPYLISLTPTQYFHSNGLHRKKLLKEKKIIFKYKKIRKISKDLVKTKYVKFFNKISKKLSKKYEEINC